MQITKESFSYSSDSATHSDNPSESPSSRSRNPTVISLAKNYRIHYVQMIKEITGTTSSRTEKRSLESPTRTTFKRQRSSLNNNTLRTLRNRIQNEENEQFYFNDERRM